jgi:hypothetical protein
VSRRLPAALLGLSLLGCALPGLPVEGPITGAWVAVEGGHAGQWPVLVLEQHGRRLSGWALEPEDTARLARISGVAIGDSVWLRFVALEGAGTAFIGTFQAHTRLAGRLSGVTGLLLPPGAVAFRRVSTAAAPIGRVPTPPRW